MLWRSHVLSGEGAMCGRSSAWVRLLDEQGQLVALATVAQTGESLHPAVVLI
jgi:hypothetical protein